jgi:hypothetical protein
MDPVIVPDTIRVYKRVIVPVCESVSVPVTISIAVSDIVRALVLDFVSVLLVASVVSAACRVTAASPLSPSLLVPVLAQLSAANAPKIGAIFRAISFTGLSLMSDAIPHSAKRFGKAKLCRRLKSPRLRRASQDRPQQTVHGFGYPTRP